MFIQLKKYVHKSNTWVDKLSYVRYAEINGLAAICMRRDGVDSMYYVHPRTFDFSPN